MSGGEIPLQSDKDASIRDLLCLYVSSDRTRGGARMRAVQRRCNELFKLDYEYSIIDNADGQFCSSYPLDIVVLERERVASSGDSLGSGGDNRTAASKTVPPPLNSADDLRARFQRGRFGRVRGRFPVPVIIWNGKNICRSSTISVQAEVILNMSKSKLKGVLSMFDAGKGAPSDPSFAVEAQRRYDIAILNELGVHYICDLMVERHKTKMGLTCSSSEKAEAGRYGDYHIQSMPYPGCEFFRDFKDNKHCGKNLVFDWNCSYIDATFATPPRRSQLGLDWTAYKSWDIVLLTQNYLRLIQEYIGSPGAARGDGGVLVHCISGWDRTPLFISLLRLSLWADGAIHRSLDAEQILYLTLGYDWMLFSHLLTDRLDKGEDIFYFCFYMLQFIASKEFSTIGASTGDAKDQASAGESVNGSLVQRSNDGATAAAAVAAVAGGGGGGGGGAAGDTAIAARPIRSPAATTASAASASETDSKSSLITSVSSDSSPSPDTVAQQEQPNVSHSRGRTHSFALVEPDDAAPDRGRNGMVQSTPSAGKAAPLLREGSLSDSEFEAARSHAMRIPGAQPLRRSASTGARPDGGSAGPSAKIGSWQLVDTDLASNSLSDHETPPFGPQKRTPLSIPPATLRSVQPPRRAPEKPDTKKVDVDAVEKRRATARNAGTAGTAAPRARQEMSVQEGLARRAKRLKTVQDIFMRAYKSSISGRPPPRGGSPVHGFLQWLPKALYAQ